MRKSMSFHGITADDLKAGGGARVGLYVNPKNAIGFGIDGVDLYFDSPAEFAAWLTKLNALAADTPCVVEMMTPEYRRLVSWCVVALDRAEPMPYYPAESFDVAMGCATGSVFDSCEGDGL